MTAEKLDTRQQIIQSADTLFYQHGFESTSFADIAQGVGISRGNFYHYFKTKDDILDAVISLRLARSQAMLDAWETESTDPVDRIQSFIHMMLMNRTKIMLYGCPVGSLCSELSKLEHAARKDAARIFSLFRDWLARQFSALGQADEANHLALHLLGRSQGLATLAIVFKDEDYIIREAADMMAWLKTFQRKDH